MVPPNLSSKSGNKSVCTVKPVKAIATKDDDECLAAN